MAQVDQPEGNGTGFIWDTEGHIITNFHVLGSGLQQLALRRAEPNPKIAQVTLLGMLPEWERPPQCVPY